MPRPSEQTDAEMHAEADALRDERRQADREDAWYFAYRLADIAWEEQEAEQSARCFSLRRWVRQLGSRFCRRVCGWWRC